MTVFLIKIFMELKELLLVLRKQKTFYIGVIFIFIFSSWIWHKEQSEKYQATLLINIGRAGASQATDYTFDSFYRLQADERFADTVVRWLSTPRIVEDIYREARLDPTPLGMKDLDRVFSAGRMSSQMISVRYTAADHQVLARLSEAAVVVLNRYTDTLNTEAKDRSWFVVIGSDPVIRDARSSLDIALSVGLVAGLFFGFWLVLLRHYFKSEEKEE